MKSSSIFRIISFSILGAAVISCYSCSHDNQVDKPSPENVDPQPEDPPVPEDDNTYKFIASDLQQKWNVGDQIYIHGSIGSWYETVTLAQENISSDGKTATAKLERVTEKPADPDGLYAAWPDQNVKHLRTKIGSKTTFEKCEGLLTAAYLGEDNTFHFKDVSSAISFTVSGDFDQYALCANNRIGLNITSFEVDYTSAGTQMGQKNNGYPFIYGTVESGKEVTICMPGDMTLKGLTLYFGKANQWTQSYTVSDNVKLAPGKTVDFGDISSSLESYSGLPPKMPAIGKCTKYPVKVVEFSGLCLSKDKDFLWAVGDEGYLARLTFEGEVLDQHYIGGDAEAVSYDPVNDNLIIGLEPDGVGIVKGPDFSGKVSTLFSLSACKNYENAGLEGLTYYKDGMIYCGAQSNSHLFLCDLESKKVLNDWKMYDTELVSEIAGLSYDPLTDWLWIIDSEAKKLFVFTGDAQTLLGAYPIGGDNPEGVCVDQTHSCVWVSDDTDTSYLLRYDFTGLSDFVIEK